jgi:hypothetical protein
MENNLFEEVQNPILENKINIGYNFDYKVTYYNYKNNEYYSDLLYHNEILKVFNLQEYDEKKIDVIQIQIYNDLVKNKKLQELMLVLANRQLSDKHDLGFIIMFSYDYFYIFHEIICAYYKTNEWNEKLIIKLEKKINKKNT